MSVNFVNYNAPYYMINTSDISEGKVAGIGQRGIKVYDVDTGNWYIVKDDLTLSALVGSSVEVNGFTETYAPVGSHTGGTDISTAVTLTKPDGASQIIIQALEQNIRFTLDGTTPTATLGFQIQAGILPMFIAVPGASIKVIEEVATASIQYQWVS